MIYLLFICSQWCSFCNCWWGGEEGCFCVVKVLIYSCVGEVGY